jgi:hypothetical protein
LPNQLKDQLLEDRLLALELIAELAILDIAELELTATELDASELSEDDKLLELLLTTLDELTGAEDAALLVGVDAVPEPPPPQALMAPTTARATRIFGEFIVDTLRLFFSFKAYPIKNDRTSRSFFVFLLLNTHYCTRCILVMFTPPEVIPSRP